MPDPTTSSTAASTMATATAPTALPFDPTMPTHTPGSLNRRNLVIARAESAAATPVPNRGFVTAMVRSPLVDLYANRPQHQFAYYLISHITIFYLIHHDIYKDRIPGTTPLIGVAFAWWDEMMPFCLYTALALVYFRDWRTVSKWEYIAMVASWSKSGVVLHQSYLAYRAGRAGGVGFPNNRTDYVVFAVVRFLVFGGLYKMVQAGLRKKWERAHVAVSKKKAKKKQKRQPPGETGGRPDGTAPPTPPPPSPPPRWYPRRPPSSASTVARLHRPLPPRLRRRVGRGVRMCRRDRDPLDTLAGRRAYWAEIRDRGW